MMQIDVLIKYVLDTKFCGQVIFMINILIQQFYHDGVTSLR